MNILLTGGSSGIGLSLIKKISNKIINNKTKLYLITRSDLIFYKSLNFDHEILDKICLIKCDLSTFFGVNYALDFIKDIKIDIIINNAGTFYQSSIDNNCNQTFILNTISPFLLSNIILKKNSNATILFITSFLHKLIKKLDLKMFNFKQDKFSSYKTYVVSKFIANLLLLDFRHYYPKAKIYCVNPGIISSNFGLIGSSFKRKLICLIRNILGKNPNIFANDLINFVYTNDIKKVDISVNNLVYEKRLTLQVYRALNRNNEILKLINKYDLTMPI